MPVFVKRSYACSHPQQLAIMQCNADSNLKAELTNHLLINHLWYCIQAPIIISSNY